MTSAVAATPVGAKVIADARNLLSSRKETTGEVDTLFQELTAYGKPTSAKEVEELNLVSIQLGKFSSLFICFPLSSFSFSYVQQLRTTLTASLLESWHKLKATNKMTKTAIQDKQVAVNNIVACVLVARWELIDTWLSYSSAIICFMFSGCLVVSYKM